MSRYPQSLDELNKALSNVDGAISGVKQLIRGNRANLHHLQLPPEKRALHIHYPYDPAVLEVQIEIFSAYVKKAQNDRQVIESLIAAKEQNDGKPNQTLLHVAWECMPAWATSAMLCFRCQRFIWE
jgi:ABC-type transporter Mla subunit MlaD